MKKYKKLLILLLLVLVISPVVIFADAQTPDTVTNVETIHNPFNCGVTDNDKCTLVDLITALLKNIVMPIAAIASVLYIIWAGFKYVQARGNPGEITKANQNLLWVLIGVGVLLGAVGISEVVQNTIKALIN